jgi:hypothetical protein
MGRQPGHVAVIEVTIPLQSVKFASQSCGAAKHVAARTTEHAPAANSFGRFIRDLQTMRPLHARPLYETDYWKSIRLSRGIKEKVFHLLVASNVSKEPLSTTMKLPTKRP